MRLVIFFVIFSYFHVSLAEAPKKLKVMIVFNGGDSTTGSPLDTLFTSSEKSAVELYKKAGFDKVIVLSSPLAVDAKPTASNLIKEIASLENVSDLHIGFISHGFGNVEASALNLSGYGMMGFPNNDPVEQKVMLAKFKAEQAERERRFTAVPLTAREAKLYSAFSSAPSSYDRTRFSIASIENSPSAPDHNNVGMGELSEALLAAQKKNPELKTTLYTGACFSGAMARTFSDFRAVQTFTASQAVVYGWGVADPDKRNVDKNAPAVLSGFENLFQDALMDGNNFLDSHDLATKKYLQLVSASAARNKKLTSLISATVPRNGMQEHIINWCIKNKTNGAPLSTTNKCRDVKYTERVRATTSISIDFYKKNPQIKSCHDNAGLIAKIKEKKTKLMEKAFKYVEGKMKSNKTHDAVFQEIVDSTKVFHKNMADQGQPLDSKSLAYLENMNQKQRRAHIQMFLKGSLHKLNADYNSCVKNKNSVYQTSCDIQKIARNSLIPNLQTWHAMVEPNKIEHLSERLSDTCNIFDPMNKDKIVPQLDCLIKYSDNFPMEAFVLSGQTARFGMSCPLYQAAAETVQDDIECIEKYEKFADCNAWSRLAELYTMGTQTFLSKEETHTMESKNGGGVR